MNRDLSGTKLGKYEVQNEIGRGGMGAVYKGYDPMLDRPVAIKVLAPHLVWEGRFVERFLREARAAARLRHPSIVTIHDVGQEGGWYYFVMEYLEGQTLTEVIQERGPLQPHEVLANLEPLAEALDYAHRRGLVHRDIKPGNIIVSPAGQVTLTDFGIVRAAQETRLTTTGTIVGTPEYMSPEQVKGLTVDARSDQDSLAVVAYEMLSGQVPFEAESTLALMHKVAYDPPPPIGQVRPELPVQVGGVLEKALAKEPGSRYATARDFFAALEQALTSGEVEVALEGVTPTEALPPSGEGPMEEAAEAGAPPVPEPDVDALSALERGRTKVMPESQPAQPEAPVSRPEEILVSPVSPSGPFSEPKPDRAISSLPAGARTKLMPGARPTALLGRRALAWTWVALGGMVLLAAVVIAFLALRPSPGGSYSVFVSNRDGRREIYRLTGAGEVERVTHTPGGAESWSPAAEPGGGLVFTSGRDGRREIYRLTESGETERVTYTPGGESWSPSPQAGGGLLFASTRDGKAEVYRITGAGEVERVTHTPGGGESWSPAAESGGGILFTSNRDGKVEIYRLTEAGEVERVTHTPGGGESWSPAVGPGGGVLFTSDRDGRREVYRITGAGEVERVTHTPGGRESWSPAVGPGGSVVFTSNRDGRREVYRITGLGEVEQVTRTPGGGESWTSDW